MNIKEVICYTLEHKRMLHKINFKEEKGEVKGDETNRE